MDQIKLIAFDLDGTLTQHKELLGEENRRVLDALARRYRLVMVGAGQTQRIFRQMGGYPIDIIGNYGLQFARYDPASASLQTVRDLQLPCDAESVDRRITALRRQFGWETYAGENVEYHPSGCVTFPVLGTKAQQADKLAFDPDRKKRRAVYDTVVQAFPEYHVFVGGSSSFDMAPRPYNKYYALDEYCRVLGLRHDQVVYVGDDYGPGGNDESVYLSDFPFIAVDDYCTLGEKLASLLQA